MNKIKAGDKVKVMRGKDSGKDGEVLKVIDGRVVVKGANIVKKHQKPNPTLNLPGGIIEIEKPINVSNVMLLDPKLNVPTRVGFREEDGKRVRYAKKSGETIK